MKNHYIIMSACLLAMSCSKAMPEEVEVVTAGEKVTFTIPETKVAIGADNGEGTRSYVFESDDVIYAVTTEGSVAAMEYKGDNSFAGEFSKPVGAEEKISLYYGCYSVENSAPVYEQKGKPWLVSPDNSYSRDDNNTIVLKATLDAPEGVVGMPIISAFGACTVDFSAKTASIASFDGTSFSGGKTISGIALESHSEADASEYTAVLNLPEGMEGGFWFKVTKDGETMYRSSAATVSDKSFKMNDFTAASVNLNVTISGFQTTYSYAAGTDGVSKNVSTANSKSNAWMNSGTAAYTISQEGIPAALLTFKSFTITGEGISGSGDESTKTISVGETTSHTAWGAKTITATVTYTDIAGNTYSNSASVTRHITGLPYTAAPPTNSGSNPWSGSANSWKSDYVRLHENTISQTFYVPNDIDADGINVYVYHNARVYSRAYKTTYEFSVGDSKLYSKTDYYVFKGGSVTDDTTYETTLPKTNPKVQCSCTYGSDDFVLEYTNTKVYSVTLKYR